MSAGADRLATLALCWRIERRDGMTIALTDHDRDLRVAGDLYAAAPGMTPSAIVRAEGLDATTMEARGALHAGAITARDLSAGRWDGARVISFAIDWSDAAATPVPLGEGRIGEVTIADGGFAAELAGIAATLERPVTEATSPGCRAMLGDRRCRVPMAGRRRFARAIACAGTTVTLDTAETEANAYGSGRLRWIGGENAGLHGTIAASAGTVVALRHPPAYPVVADTLVELTEGCDRTIATCADRFGNALHFRGEPYLPGIDLLTRYPGA